jgi:hypothetical protein
MANEPRVKVPVSFLEKVASYVDYRQGEAQDAATKRASEKAELETSASIIVDALVKKGYVSTDQANIAKESLVENHLDTLRSFAKLAQFLASPTSLGKAASEYGRVSTESNLPASERRYLQQLGLLDQVE